MDAKASPLNTHLPIALNSKNYEVRAHAKVLRIETAKDGLATGVTYVDAHGTEHFQPADVVVVSAFTLENNRMLLLSRSKAHPDGIGNDRGRVGKNYTYQIYPAPVTGFWEGKKLNMYMGNTCTIKIIYDYNADNFDHSDLAFHRRVAALLRAAANVSLSTPSAIRRTRNGRSWGAEWKGEIRKGWDSTASIVTEGESLPYLDQFVDLDPNYRDKWGQPLLRISFDWHQNERDLWRFVAERALEIMNAMNPTKIVDFKPEIPAYNIEKYQSTHPTGGCIMGTSPDNSVTNTYGQVWDTPNVFVTGAALFPQNPGANPTGTVGAVTYRTAEAMSGPLLQASRGIARIGAESKRSDDAAPADHRDRGVSGRFAGLSPPQRARLPQLGADAAALPTPARRQGGARRD